MMSRNLPNLFLIYIPFAKVRALSRLSFADGQDVWLGAWIAQNVTSDLQLACGPACIGPQAWLC